MNRSSVFFSPWAIIAALAIAILIPSCTSDRLRPDVSGVEVNLKTNRLDRDLFSGSTENFKELNADLLEKYGEFYALYLSEIIKIGDPDYPMIATNLEMFVNEANWRETQNQIDEIFPDMEPYNSGFELAFRYHRHHFPKEPIPEIIYYNSGFNVGVYPDTTFLGIGLEWFLGTENPVIQRLDPERFPQYFKDKLQPKYLVNNAVKGWMMVKHQHMVTKEDFMNLLMFHGKMMLMMDALFPDVADEIKINYSTENLEWCSKNEYNIWAHLVEEDLLYSTNPKYLAGFFNDGPFTPAFQNDSPGRVGVWVGWQVMRQYMDKNPDVSLQQMLREDNAQKILKHYKP